MGVKSHLILFLMP